MRHAVLALACLAAAPAGAAALSDLLMAPRLFAGAEVGSAVVYAETRDVPEAEGMTVTDVADGRIRLEVVSPDELRLVRETGDGAAQPVGTFGPGTANPFLLYFLENNVRAMAEATGGSPFYIRNRIREALVAADLGAADGAVREVELAPFAGNPNRGRMGPFADLVIRLRFDPADPARILELSADTADGEGGYHERMTLVAEE
ncbi:hypothetical protein [Amaricoccus sp.]|uniref:hypothetical protein n=1 Tax=Amaricoccus sp. TaxID=1872485 RepID=UPI001B62AA31|nr:hypothetical protein [Amaricoccus sp.]MBP7001117.1 hypothetical protein [Amaricoccus sp.]